MENWEMEKRFALQLKAERILQTKLKIPPRSASFDF